MQVQNGVLQYPGVVTGLSARGNWLQAAVYELLVRRLEEVAGLQYVAGGPGPYGREFKMKGNEKQKTDDCNLAQHHPPLSGCDPGYLSIAECTFPLLPGGSRDAERIAWDTPSSQKCVCAFPIFFAFLPLLLCTGCPSACQGWVSFHTFPPFSACVLPACCVLPLPAVCL